MFSVAVNVWYGLQYSHFLIFKSCEIPSLVCVLAYWLVSNKQYDRSNEMTLAGLH